MSKLEKTILWILKAAQEYKISDLSKLQIHKLVYLIDVEARKFSGDSFFAHEVTFQRNRMGPISLDVYHALNNIASYINLTVSCDKGFTAPRHGYSLKRGLDIERFKLGENDMLFMGSIIQDYICLSQFKLKQLAYSTEPMIDIQKREKLANIDCMVGENLNMDLVAVDEELVNAISDE